MDVLQKNPFISWKIEEKGTWGIYNVEGVDEMTRTLVPYYYFFKMLELWIIKN